MAVGMAVATMGRDDAAAGEECAGSDELPDDGEERQRIVAAAELLGQLLLQDVERAEGGVSPRLGVREAQPVPPGDEPAPPPKQQ